MGGDIVRNATERAGSARVQGFCFALLLFSALGLSWSVWTMVSTDPDAYMQVRVSIPDHAAGDDPLITYDRIIHKPFRAAWLVEMHRFDGDVSRFVCSGAGENEYDPLEKIGEVHLYAWYMGAECDVPPGRYVLKTVWRTHTGVAIKNHSNTFTIR